MFGISFGDASPEKEVASEPISATPEEMSEMSDMLKQFSFVSESYAVSSEDYEVIKGRRAMIVRDMPDVERKTEVATALACIDVALDQAEGDKDALLSRIGIDLVAALAPRFAADAAFLETVLKEAVDRYRSGLLATFSDALLDSVENETHVAEGALAAV